jgi:hypothetical protein
MGRLGAAILALLSIAALVWRWSFAIPLVWIFNLWGTIDLLYAFYNAIVLEIEPRLFGAAFYIPTMIVPPLLVIHALIFDPFENRKSVGGMRKRTRGRTRTICQRSATI